MTTRFVRLLPITFSIIAAVLSIAALVRTLDHEERRTEEIPRFISGGPTDLNDLKGIIQTHKAEWDRSRLNKEYGCGIHSYGVGCWLDFPAFYDRISGAGERRHIREKWNKTLSLDPKLFAFHKRLTQSVAIPDIRSFVPAVAPIQNWKEMKRGLFLFDGQPDLCKQSRDRLLIGIEFDAPPQDIVPLYLTVYCSQHGR